MSQHEDDIILHQDEVERVVDRQITHNNRLQMRTMEGIFTPDAAITGGGLFGDFYIVGDEVVVAMELYKVTAAAIVAGTGINLGQFADEFSPAETQWGGSGGVGRAGLTGDATVNVAGQFTINGSGLLRFFPWTSSASAANRMFQAEGIRWALADPDAARAFVAAL